MHFGRCQIIAQIARVQINRVRPDDRYVLIDAGRQHIRGNLAHSRPRVASDVKKDVLSMAAGYWAIGVSLFRINVRPSVQHKCHLVRLPWYQMMTSLDRPKVAALEDPQSPGIS